MELSLPEARHAIRAAVGFKSGRRRPSRQAIGAVAREMHGPGVISPSRKCHALSIKCAVLDTVFLQNTTTYNRNGVYLIYTSSSPSAITGGSWDAYGTLQAQPNHLITSP